MHNSGLQIEYKAPAELVPYARNARTHSADQIEKLKASVLQFGFTNPILVGAGNVVLAGHGRLAAAKELRMETVPTLSLSHLTQEQQRAYILADNRLALDAGWDDELLAQELAALHQDGFDLEVVGFDDDELAGLLPEQFGAERDGEDECPEAQATAIACVGDVWLCGPHRVACGDSTSQEAVARLLGAVKPHLMVTDPPYGVEYDPAWRNRAERLNGDAYGARAVGVVHNDDRADWSPAWALFPGSVAYVWHAGRHAATVQHSLEVAGFEIRCQVIWAKTRFAISRGHYHWQHEPCWYAVRKGATGHWAGDRSQTTLWSIAHNISETGHSTQKPVECMRRPIENNSSPGQAVYDPFLGSGTTLIAAETCGRICYGMEISPIYVDIIVRRWQEFTGLQATLEATGEPFDLRAAATDVDASETQAETQSERTQTDAAGPAEALLVARTARTSAGKEAACH